jgi:hypothetical protein
MANPVHRILDQPDLALEAWAKRLEGSGVMDTVAAHRGRSDVTASPARRILDQQGRCFQAE